MQAAAVGVGAAASGAGASRMGYSPVGTSEALAPAVGAFVLAAPGIAWGMHEIREWLNQDDPAPELSAGVIEQMVESNLNTRWSHDASNIIDNQNIVNGIRHVAYNDGKLAAIEALQDGLSQNDVETLAVNAAQDHLATVQENMLSSWNETMLEVHAQHDPIVDHDTMDDSNYFHVLEWYDTSNAMNSNVLGTRDLITESVDLVNGDTMQVEGQEMMSTDTPLLRPDIWDNSAESYAIGVVYDSTGTGDFAELDGMTFPFDDPISLRDQVSEHILITGLAPGYGEVWDDIIQAEIEVSNGLQTWVAGIYEDFEAGELDLEDLVSPQMLSEMLSEQTEASQGVADLIGLNQPVDLEHEVRIELLEGDYENANLYGLMGTMGASSLEVGDVVTPGEENWFLAYDLSTPHGEWEWFEIGLIDGVATFTREPYDGAIFEIETTADESVVVGVEDFEENGDWTVDLSGELDDNTADIVEVTFYAEQEESETELIHVTDQFEVISVDGDDDPETAPSVTFEEPTETHSDDNYMTAEDFQQQSDDLNALVEEIEEAIEGNGGAGGWWPDFGDVGGGMIAGVLVLGAIIFGIAQLGD